MKKHKKLLSALGVVAIVGLLICWYIVDTPYRQAEQLIDAIEANDVDKVRQMLEAGVDPDGLTTSETVSFLLNFVESEARRPISEACAGDNVEIVRLLLEYGASPNDNKIAGWSPVRSVLHRYHETDLEMLQLLVSYGADTTYVESEGEHEPVFAAAYMRPTIKGDYNEDAARGITEIVMYLLDNRSVNIQSPLNGNTLLFQAVPSGNFYLVKHLIEQGADVRIISKYGLTAYSYAKKYGYNEIAELLKP